jgi:hypothetical protein
MANKLCKYCKSEIHVDAKICPICKKRQGFSKRTIILLLVIVLILVSIPVCCLGGIFVYSNFISETSTARIYRDASKMSEEDYKAACKSVSYDEIARDDDALKGEKLTFKGEVIQAMNGTYRMNVTETTYGYTDTILFTADDSSLSGKVIEDDIVIIWGVSKGNYTYEALLGNKVTVPRIQVVYLENLSDLTEPPTQAVDTTKKSKH